MFAAAQTNAVAPAPARPFERIEAAANRAESISTGLAAFLDRVNGAPPTSGGRDTASAVPGYVNQLDRLHYALELIEGQLQQIHALG